MSARAEVRKAIANSISVGVTGVGGRVFSRKRNAIRLDELPCVAVQANEAAVEYLTNSEGPGSRIQHRTVTTTVTSIVSEAPDTADDDADALAAQVQSTLSDFTTLIPGKIIEGQLIGERSEAAEVEGGFAIVVVSTFQHVVLTNENNPGQLV